MIQIADIYEILSMLLGYYVLGKLCFLVCEKLSSVLPYEQEL